MPEATIPFSTDYPLYRYIINPLADRICFIHPNIITFVGLLLVAPIAWTMWTASPLWIVGAWVLTRHFIDCLDGAVARRCELKSEWGAIFDIVCDTFYMIVIAGIICYRALTAADINLKTVIIINAMIIWSYSMICICYEKLYGIKRQPTFVELIGHDNGVITALILVFIYGWAYEKI